MPEVFTHTRRVEFAETDMAGLMHFAEFFRYMEAAEHALLRSLGRSVHEHVPGGVVSFVRVRAECDYRKPFHFEDVVDIEVRVREVNPKSVKYGFTFRKTDDDRGAEHATGTITVVCILKREGENTIAAIDIPEDIALLLQNLEGA